MNARALFVKFISACDARRFPNRLGVLMLALSGLALGCSPDAELPNPASDGKPGVKKVARFSALDRQRDGRYFLKSSQTPFTGVAEDSHPNGQLRWRATFREGQPDGNWDEWESDGLHVGHREFEGGRLVKEALPEELQQRIQTASESEMIEALAFIEQQAAVEDAVRTESGIVIQAITAGTGPSPAADDTVRVHYHGTLRDGTVFDSSVDRGEPATFPLTGVIPCWTEGLQRIGVGGKSRLVCPPDLAYGPQGRPGIPGNAALVFEVELLEIVEN